jgi:hypothetical protein
VAPEEECLVTLGQGQTLVQTPVPPKKDKYFSFASISVTKGVFFFPSFLSFFSFSFPQDKSLSSRYACLVLGAHTHPGKVRGEFFYHML